MDNYPSNVRQAELLEGALTGLDLAAERALIASASRLAPPRPATLPDLHRPLSSGSRCVCSMHVVPWVPCGLLTALMPFLIMFWSPGTKIACSCVSAMSLGSNHRADWCLMPISVPLLQPQSVSLCSSVMPPVHS